MTESIRAADVLARSMHGPDWDGITGAFAFEDQVAALLALVPEGDVVIRRDEHRTVAGLEVAPGLCWGCNGSKYERLLGEDNAEVVIAWDLARRQYIGLAEHHGLVEMEVWL